MDFYADLAGKPRVERFAPEKREKPVHDPSTGRLERDVKSDIVHELRHHPKVAWFAEINSGEWVSDNRRIKGYYLHIPGEKQVSSGIADIIGQLKGGQFFAIEVKREIGGVVSDKQAAFISVVQDGGGRATVARSSKEVIQFLY